LIIPFNRPPKTAKSGAYLLDALESCKYSGDGIYTKKCTEWLESKVGYGEALMTTSGSHALDMAAYLCGIKPGDEAIMPSYTFSSTANAFAGRGAKIVFVDIRPDTMNIDESLIEAAITPKTKAIVPVHYAGVSCEMDEINPLAEKYGLKVVEDAAQAILSTYQGKPCGALSDFGCFSFHETKNFSMGEGGALVIRSKEDAERAEILREKGTNRSRFYRGEIDKYTWVDWGSSYLPSEFLCAYLWSQLEIADEITDDRLASWNMYYEGLGGLGLDGEGLIELPRIPVGCVHNAHMFYIKARDGEERDSLLEWLKKEGIYAVFHYIPLHSAPAGKKFGFFHGEDRFTTRESERMIRLPLFYGLKREEIFNTIEKIKNYYRL
jgi:dTDP-4-amino-4,6-dideoxygalactose transaminase